MDDMIIGITHANGLAAEALLKALLQIDIEKDSIRLYSHGDSVGNRLSYGGQYLVALDQQEDSFEQCSLVMQLEADEVLSEKINKEGAILLRQGGDLYFSAEAEHESSIDYSQHTFDLVDSEAYLILKILQSIHQSNNIVSAQVNVLQPVSVKGQQGVDELASQTVSLLNARPVEPNIFPVQQSFNLYAKNSAEESLNIARQVKFNLGEETESVQVQCIQTPVFYGTTLVCTVQCEFALSESQLENQFNELIATQSIADKTAIISPVSSLQEESMLIVSQTLVSEQNAKCVQLVITADHFRHGSAELFLNAMLVIRKTFL